MIDLIRFGILQSLDYWTAKHLYKLYLKNKKVEDEYANCKECNHFKNNYCFLKCKNVGADWLFCNRFKEIKNE